MAKRRSQATPSVGKANAPSPSPSPSPSPFNQRLAIAALLALAILPYLPSLANGFVYDDMVLIVGKTAPATFREALTVFTEKHHPSGLPYYRPIAALTLSLQQMIWGASSRPFHAFNLALLAIVALVARALFAVVAPVAPTARVRDYAPFVFALIFAWHPNVSSVVHAIAGRETLLVLAFMGGSAWAFLHGGRRHFALALVLFVGALLCKEQAIALPLIFVLADWLKLTPDSPRGKSLVAWVTRYAWIALVVIAYFVVRARVLNTGVEMPAHVIKLAIFDQPLRPLGSAIYTLQTSFVPTVALRYEPHFVAWWSPSRLLVTLAIVALLFGLAHRYAKREHAALWFWAGWALVTLLPSANLVDQETQFDERYAVLPLVGLIGFVALVAGTLWPLPRWRSTVEITVAAWLVTCGAISHQRGQYFESDLRFLSQWAESDPTSHQARASLAEYYQNRREYAQALVYSHQALDAIHQSMPEPECIRIHFTVADLATKTGHYDDAVAQYEEILRMKPSYNGARKRLESARALQQQAATTTPVATAAAVADSAPHELAADLKARLVEQLSAPDLTGSSVWFAATSLDPGSVRRQQELEQLFKDAGWTVRGTELVNFRVKPGLFLFAGDAEPSAYVQRLYDAFTKAGLPFATYAVDYRAFSASRKQTDPTWSGFTIAPKQDFVIAVGRLSD